MTLARDIRQVRTAVLDIACELAGPSDGPSVVLAHGFPYSPRVFDEVVPRLVAAGCRTIVPYLRGYGGTRFLDAATPRSGQQAAIGHDLRDLLDALGVAQAVLAGFDWGGRGACIVAALWPDRVRGLVTSCGYQIQDLAAAAVPADPLSERRFWYQYYFHTERGRAGLTQNRVALARLLWQLWSPNWAFDEARFRATAEAFENPDFVEVVIHSYRHRHGNAAGDPRYAASEALLARLPTIGVPSIALHGVTDDVMAPALSADHARYFTGPYERRLLPGVGHNTPQEAPEAFARAVLDLCKR